MGSIEVDVELCCGYQEQHDIDSISSKLPANYMVIERSKQLFISFEDKISEPHTLNQAIVSFLSGLVMEDVVPLKATIRVGLFYNVSETVVCPVILSRQSIEPI